MARSSRAAVQPGDALAGVIASGASSSHATRTLAGFADQRRGVPRRAARARTAAEYRTDREAARPATTIRSPRVLLISKKTVERQRADILEKLGMRDRVDLTRYAIQRGLVQP
jgi:hypothetical protein